MLELSWHMIIILSGMVVLMFAVCVEHQSVRSF
ncbi:hypothetical protein C3L33_10635, partial [Rhododendron williamsianum]